MSKTSYILSLSGNPVAVINAESKADLNVKTERAIREEVCADADGFKLYIGEIGDWGEDTEIEVTYKSDGVKVKEKEFVLMKCVSY